MVSLQRKALEVCRDVDETPAGFYEHPAFDGGRNIFCAVAAEGAGGGAAGDAPGAASTRPAPDDTSDAAPAAGRLVGYAILYRSPDPSYLYMDIKVDPDLDPADRAAVKDALFEKVVGRARQIKSEVPFSQETLLYGCYFAEGRQSLDYLASKGFTRWESLCAVTLSRGLEGVILKVTRPLGVEVRPWVLETEEDQVRYLMAHNESLPYNYLDLPTLQHFLRTRKAAILGAFAEDEVAGNSVLLCENGVGTIEYLFVREPWRGKGVGRYLVRESLKHFQDRGMDRAEVVTGAGNEAALHLYESMGYKVVREAVSLGLKI